MAYIDVDKVLKNLPNGLTYKSSVKRVLTQAEEADVVEIDDSLEIVIMSAIRYAIGRRTYVPSSVINFTISLLSKLSVSTLSVIERDISEAESYGDEKIDKPDWMMFLRKIGEEKERRKMNKCKNCIRYTECKDYVDENESFPEIGGCEAFRKAKNN